MKRPVNIIKRRKTKAFVTLENDLVRDRRLTLDEHGMLHYLLSLPDDWEVSRDHCAKFWDIGRDKCARIFKRLRECGWAQVERVHADDGTFVGVRWIITDEPCAASPDGSSDVEIDADLVDEATAGKPGSVANHDTENPVHGSPVTRVTRDTEKACHGLYIDSKKTDSEENRILQKPDVADAAAREPLITQPAMDLAGHLLVIAGHNPEFWPPGWCGAPMRVQAWLNQGWPAEIIVAATKSAASRKTGPPAASVQYFENAIAEEIARQSRPVPEIPDVVQATQHHRSRPQGNAFARLAARLGSSAGDPFDGGSSGDS